MNACRLHRQHRAGRHRGALAGSLHEPRARDLVLSRRADARHQRPRAGPPGEARLAARPPLHRHHRLRRPREQSIEALRAGAFWYLEKPFEQASSRRGAQAGRAGHRARPPQDRESHAPASQLQPPLPLREHRRHQQAGLGACSTSWRRSPTPTAPCSSPARAAPARSSIARAIHYNSRRAERMLRHGELRRHPRGAARVGALSATCKGAFTNAVSHREGRFAVGRRRHDLPRRDRGHEPEPPGQAPAGPPGPDLRARGLVEDQTRRRPRDRRDPPGPAETRSRRSASARICTTA